MCAPFFASSLKFRARSADMSFPQLGYPQFLGASHEAYGSDRPASAREGGTESGVSSSANTATAAAAAAVGSVLGMYGSPWAAHNYSAFLPYSGATDLALLSQMVRADGFFGERQSGRYRAISAQRCRDD